MGHTAFSLTRVVAGVPREIECSTLWGSIILAGCRDGTLLVYSNPRNSRGKMAELLDTKAAFVPGRISRLDVIPLQASTLSDSAVLVVLADCIRTFELTGFHPLATLPQSSGASLYSLVADSGRLAAAVNKRVLLYSYEGEV